MTVSPIPLVDLRLQHREVEAEVRAGMDAVLSHGMYVGGPEIADFESAFAELCGVPHCVGVANGTDALEIVLRAAGIGAGDEVVLPANTFVATAEAVARAGATPVLADVDAQTLLLDAEHAAAVVTPRTAAICAVHLYGQVAPVEALAEVAESCGAMLVEDAAQAHGARRHGLRAGSLGRAAGFSFYPGKNLGAYGDAGAVTTADAELAGRVRSIANHGGTSHYQHELLGLNSRLDTIQAVVLAAKLRRLEAWNAARREAAGRYDEMLAGRPGVVLPVTLAGNEHAWHLYVVRVAGRDAVLGRLRAAGVGAGIHYPRAVHLTEAFGFLGRGPGSFPVAERAAASVLSLPLFPGITADQQERVVAALSDALGGAA